MSVSVCTGPDRGSDIKDTPMERTVADGSKRSLEILYKHKGTSTPLTLKHTSALQTQTTVKSIWHLRNVTQITVLLLHHT